MAWNNYNNTQKGAFIGSIFGAAGGAGGAAIGNLTEGFSGWGNKSEAEKLGVISGKSGVGGKIAAPFLQSTWGGDDSRLNEIKKAQEEANKSEWNTAKVTPQMLDSYNKWSQEYAQMKAAEKYGLTDAEKNLAISQNAQGMNFAQMNAERAGGNAGAYINSVLNAGNNEFGLKLASADAELQRQKRMQTLSALEGLNRNASVFQDVNSMNFQKQMLAEQALGQAESDWYANRQSDRRALISSVGALAGAGIKGGA
jgi:hypothetical protein